MNKYHNKNCCKSIYREALKADMKLNKEQSMTHTQKSMERFEQNIRSLWFLSNRVDEILEILLLNTVSGRKVRKRPLLTLVSCFYFIKY